MAKVPRSGPRGTARQGPDDSREQKLRADGCATVCGIDEAGRGPLAGPLAVAAVVLPTGVHFDGLDDSKKLPSARRRELAEEIKAHPGVAAVCLLIEPDEIDRLNILEATREGMRRVVERLPVRPDAALVDGLPVLDFPICQEAVVGGDGKSVSIAAASVLAKVTRDRYMEDVDVLWPEYGFARHKGYPVPSHLTALRRHGPCPIHRLSFAPVAQATLALDP